MWVSADPDRVSALRSSSNSRVCFQEIRKAWKRPKEGVVFPLPPTAEKVFDNFGRWLHIGNALDTLSRSKAHKIKIACRVSHW